jgi:thiol-disulfide isomerase/thioredoxin
MRPLALAGGAALCAMTFVLGGCTSDSGIESGDGQGFVSGDGTARVLEPAERQPAPDVVGTTLTGDEVSLDDYAGEVVVLNVWGSWCAPCRAEAPALQEVYSENRKDGVSFLGINTRDQDAAAMAFEENFDITYPSLVDENGELLLAFRDSLPASAIPSTLVVDREGRIAARVLGPTTYSQLTELVEQVASET